MNRSKNINRDHHQWVSLTQLKSFVLHLGSRAYVALLSFGDWVEVEAKLEKISIKPK